MQSIIIFVGGSIIFCTIIAESVSPRGWFGVWMPPGDISLVDLEPDGF